MMEENGLSRNQALEQLAKQKDNRTETEILLDDSIPFYQEDVDSGNNENISGKNYYIKDGKKVELIKRPYAPEIATDNTMVNVTEIDGDPIPEFEKTADLREWILNNLAIFGDVKIEATGQIINVTKGGVRKAIKKRGKAHHQTYAKLKDVIRNAQYVGFEKK